MARILHRLALAVAVVVALAACGGNDADTAAGTSPADVPSPTGTTEPATDGGTETPTDAATGEVTVATTSSELGDILVDGDGRTLYVFDQDTEGESTCYDDCASNWPPVAGEPEAGEGVDTSLLGTTERRDGTLQVTYAGAPLYLFAGDAAAGDTNGQGVGDVWWVVAPDGQKIADSSGGESMGY